MKKFPSIPRISNAPETFLKQGRLWILEKVDGANFRFQLHRSGRIRFGDRSRVYEDPDDVPESYQHAVRHVQEHLDRNALRQAVDDVEDFVFFGEAMHHHTVAYDWDRTPSFLGFDVWSDSAEEFRPPAAVEQIYDRIGLQPVNVFEQDVPAETFDPDSYSIPQSEWYDGPAEGVILRNEQDERAKLLHQEFREVDETIPVDGSAIELAAKYATQHRFEKLASKLKDRGRPVTFQLLYDRVLEDIVREEHKQLHHGDRTVDMRAFRSEVAARTRKFLDTDDRAVHEDDR